MTIDEMYSLAIHEGNTFTTIPADGTPKDVEIKAGETQYFKVLVRNRLGPCVISFDKCCLMDLTLAASLTDVMPEATNSNATSYKMKSYIKVVVPLKKKANH
jgi:hypothetical protein